MRYPIVKLIAGKETRDLLRDRRTVMLILVLPLLLYPLFGFAGFVLASGYIKQPTTVGVVGDVGRDSPPLFADSGTAFADGLISAKSEGGPVIVKAIPEAEAGESLNSKAVDVVVVIPAGFAEAVAQNRKPTIELRIRDGDEKSKLAGKRVQGILASWAAKVRDRRFEKANLPKDFDKPFEVKDPDYKKDEQKKGADELRDQFVKIFPFILVIWVVAGAIQPAVDLTAGEKERGTMETLLISPAERSEIVVGKFLAVTLFGFCSVVWNVLWLTVAGLLFGAWLGAPVVNLPGVLGCVVLGLPIAMLFSAVSLALGVFARSTKEGQYYLMPLMLVAMPLAFWGMMPGTELTPGMSLVPVTGPMLLQQKLLAVTADPIPWEYFAPVLGSHAVYISVALGLAIFQFKRESVLFRETGPAKSGGEGLFGKLFRRKASA